MAANDHAGYVRARRGLMLAIAALWLCFALVLPVLAARVPAINVFGQTIGFSVIAEISLVALVVALFWFARRQNELERAHSDQ